MLGHLKSILRDIFYEKTSTGDYKFSLGRMLLIIIFTAAMTVWYTQVDLPGTMMNVLMFLLAYNFGSKGLTILDKLTENKKK